MEGIATTENDRHHELASSGPHFADERTIRSAQPVVPFETLAKEKRRRGLMLGGAFVIACLLGATAAMALIRLRQPRIVPQTTTAPLEAETTDETEDQAKVSATEPESVSDSQPIAKADTVEVAEPKQEKLKNKPKKQALAPSPVRITVVTSPPSSGDARLIDQWEEKRQRRVRPRDPQQNNHSDLFRIREIFEGPRRSRRASN